MLSAVLQVTAAEAGWSLGDLKSCIFDASLFGDENGISSVGLEPVRSEGTEMLLIDKRKDAGIDARSPLAKDNASIVSSSERLALECGT